MAGSRDIFEEIIDVADGRVQGDAAASVLARVQADPELHQFHAWVTEFLATSAANPLQTPPASTRAMLERLLPPRRTLADGVKDTIGSIARLVRDVPRGTAFAGARGVSGTRRQLVFSTDIGADLVLELDVDADPMYITGQLLGGSPSYTARFTGDGGAVNVAADEFGEFVTTVPAMSFLRLDLLSDDGSVTIVDLTPFLDEAE